MLTNFTPEVKAQNVKEPRCLCLNSTYSSRETSRRRLETQCHYCAQYLTVCVADNEVGHGGTEAAIYFKHVWAQSKATKTFLEIKRTNKHQPVRFTTASLSFMSTAGEKHVFFTVHHFFCQTGVWEKG